MTQRVENTDVAQIGLTPEGQRDMEAVMVTGWFALAQDAYRLAISLALANKIIALPEQVKGAQTRYNFVGGIDSDGKVRTLISAFRPEDGDVPARTAERLAHAGLRLMAERLTTNEALLSETLGFKEDSEIVGKGA